MTSVKEVNKKPLISNEGQIEKLIVADQRFPAAILTIKVKV